MQVPWDGFGGAAATDGFSPPQIADAPASAEAKAHRSEDGPSRRQSRQSVAAGKENCAKAAPARSPGSTSIHATLQPACSAGPATVARIDTCVAGPQTSGGSADKQHAQTAASGWSPADDGEEPLSQKPLVQIRKEMLQSQQKRSSRSPHAQGMPADGAVPCGQGSLRGVTREGRTDGLQLHLASVQLPAPPSRQGFGTLQADELSGSGCMQLSQVPLAMWTSKQPTGTAHGDAAMSSAEMPLSQMPLAERAPPAPDHASRQQLSGTAARHLDAATQAARNLLAHRKENDQAAPVRVSRGAPPKDAAAAEAGAGVRRSGSTTVKTEAQQQSWASSAAHLRTQTRPQSVDVAADAEDPTEDLTLHQRQWVASKQLAASRCGVAAARAASGAPSPTPAASARDGARSAADELVGQYGRRAAMAAAAGDQAGIIEAIKGLERSLCGIAQRVAGSVVHNGAQDGCHALGSDTAGVANPHLMTKPHEDDQRADAAPGPAAAPVRHGGFWLPAPTAMPDPVSGVEADTSQPPRSAGDAQTAAQPRSAGIAPWRAAQQPRANDGAQAAVFQQEGACGTRTASCQAAAMKQGSATAAPPSHLTMSEGVQRQGMEADCPATSADPGNRQPDGSGAASHPLEAAMDWSGAGCDLFCARG